MAVSLLVQGILFLSIKNVETHFLPPSNMLKWRGLRGLDVRCAAPQGGAEARRAPRGLLTEALDILLRAALRARDAERLLVT